MTLVNEEIGQISGTQVQGTASVRGVCPPPSPGSAVTVCPRTLQCLFSRVHSLHPNQVTNVWRVSVITIGSRIVQMGQEFCFVCLEPFPSPDGSSVCPACGPDRPEAAPSLLAELGSGPGSVSLLSVFVTCSNCSYSPFRRGRKGRGADCGRRGWAGQESGGGRRGNCS